MSAAVDLGVQNTWVHSDLHTFMQLIDSVWPTVETTKSFLKYLSRLTRWTDFRQIIDAKPTQEIIWSLTIPSLISNILHIRIHSGRCSPMQLIDSGYPTGETTVFLVIFSTANYRCQSDTGNYLARHSIRSVFAHCRFAAADAFICR